MPMISRYVWYDQIFPRLQDDTAAANVNFCSWV